MLKKIKTTDLELGAMYSAPLFFDDGENMLLPLGSPVTDYELDILKEWKISFITTAGRKITQEDINKNKSLEDLEELEELIEIEEIDQNNGDSIAINGTKVTRSELATVDPKNILKLNKDKQTTELYKAYNDIIKKLEKLFQDIKDRKQVKMRAFDKYALIIKSLVEKKPSLCVSFVLDTKLDEDNLARSSINTAILSIILAKELKLSDDKITEITISALIHDIGMLKIPEKLLNKKGQLTDVEKQAIATHTSYSYKVAINELMYPENIALNLLQHHERWDGNGMPNGIIGDEISLEARIISVADAFVAMITPKPYRDLMLGYQAMKNILSDNARRFDPELIKIMIRNIGIYPIGSIVLMNNASLARVIKSAPATPMRPSIKILIDETGEVLGEDSKIIDLKDNKNLFIVRAIDPRAYVDK